MKKLNVVLSVLAIGTSLVLAQSARAESLDGLDEVGKEIKLSPEKTQQLGSAVQAVAKEHGLEITGMMWTSGFNGAFFVDNDIWRMSVRARDTDTYETSKVENVYARIYDGGPFKMGFEYKWVLAFLTNGMKVDELEGAKFGRGFSVGTPFAGTEIGIVPGETTGSSIILVQPNVGLMLGVVTFPKLEFSRDRAKLAD